MPNNDLISRSSVLKGFEEIQESAWYNYGKEPNRDFPYPHLEYIARKEAVEIICDVCIKQEPAVDAEPVVMCKQCKQWDDSSEGRYVGGWCFCNRLQISTSPDWFCADGEAKHEQTD